MGCCISTKTTSPRPNTDASTLHNGGSRSPPPVDEETVVKEVLSETKLPPPPVPSGFHGSGRMLHQNGATAALDKDDHYHVGSEIHNTRSGSFWTENNAAFQWPRLDSRPSPGEVKREKTAGRSPARRSNSSPGRAKPGSGYSRKTATGESSGRRSRSPAIRSDSGSSKTGLDANKSTRKTGNHSGRVGIGSGEKEREETTRRPPTTSNELLENSFVSLECFIFL